MKARDPDVIKIGRYQETTGHFFQVSEIMNRTGFVRDGIAKDVIDNTTSLPM